LKVVIEADPQDDDARKSISRVTPLLQQQQEKQKEEMMGNRKSLIFVSST